jgi:hypothetical protein
MKHKNVFVKKEDLTGEKNLILEYIIQKMELCYTQYIIFAGLTFVAFLIILLTFLLPNITLSMRIVPLVFSFIFWLISKKGKENFIMAHVGYGLAESMYDFKIRDKYNL